jgi:hypothetical protein
MWEGRSVYSVLLVKPEGKRLLGRPMHSWEDIIKMDLQDGGHALDCLSQYTDGWQELVNAVMKFSFHKMQGLSCLAEKWLTSKKCCAPWSN